MSLPWLPEATMFPYARPSYWCLRLSGRKRSMNGGCWEKFDEKMCVYCHKLNFFVMTQLLHKRYITSTADSKEVVERFAWEQKKLHRHRLAWVGLESTLETIQLNIGLFFLLHWWTSIQYTAYWKICPSTDLVKIARNVAQMECNLWKRKWSSHRK